MPIVTIPQPKDDLVILPRKEYEQILVFKKIFPTFKPTPSQIKKLRQAEKNFKAGKSIPWSQIKDELADLYRKSKPKTVAKIPR